MLSYITSQYQCLKTVLYKCYHYTLQQLPIGFVMKRILDNSGLHDSLITTKLGQYCGFSLCYQQLKTLVVRPMITSCCVRILSEFCKKCEFCLPLKLYRNTFWNQECAYISGPMAKLCIDEVARLTENPGTVFCICEYSPLEECELVQSCRVW